MQGNTRPLKNAFLCFYVLCIVYSGFAYPLAYGRGFWPWNRGWFMFSSDNGYDYELQAIGELEDGTRVDIGVGSIFRFAVGDGNRFQETPRYKERMQQMAEYLCTRFPVRAVTLTDHSWLRTPGKRIPLAEVAPSKIKKTIWVDRHKCGF